MPKHTPTHQVHVSQGKRQVVSQGIKHTPIKNAGKKVK